MNIDTNQFIIQNLTPAGHWVDFHHRCIRLRAVKMTLFSNKSYINMSLVWLHMDKTDVSEAHVSDVELYFDQRFNVR